MIHTPSTMSVVVFAIFVAFTLGLSFYFAAKTKSAAGYFAAGGQIHWFVNGVAFAGDYLSAASFLVFSGKVEWNFVAVMAPASPRRLLLSRIMDWPR